MLIIHNVETNEIIEREPTAEELAQLAIDQAEAAALKEAELAREAARTELLARLGITQDEAKLLLGGI